MGRPTRRYSNDYHSYDDSMGKNRINCCRENSVIEMK